MNDEIYEAVRRRAYDEKRSVAAEIRSVIDGLVALGEAARPVGRDAKRHEAAGARAAKPGPADEAGKCSCGRFTVLP